MRLSKHGLKRAIRPFVPVGILEHLNRRRYELDKMRRSQRPSVPDPMIPGGSAFADYRHPTALILYWSHVFGTAEGPAEALGEALSTLQFRVTMLNTSSDADIEACAGSGTRYDIAISVGSPPLAKQAQGKPVFELFGDLFFLWGLDSIINDLARVWAVQTYWEAARRSTRLRFLFPDRSYTDLIGEALTPAQAQYFPFGGFYDSLPNTGLSGRRVSRLAVVATIGTELAEVGAHTIAGVIESEGSALLSPSQRDRLGEALQAPGTPANVTWLAREVLGVDLSRLLSWEFLPLLTRIDAFEKRRRRLLIIENLRGLPIDFYGAGWERFVGDCGSFQFHGIIPFAGISRVARAYPGLINFDPNWDDGVHDRVFTALGNGCRVLTNANRAHRDIERPEGSLLAYDHNGPDARHDAEALLAAQPMAECDVMRFRQANNWVARADHFLRAIA